MSFFGDFGVLSQSFFKYIHSKQIPDDSHKPQAIVFNNNKSNETYLDCIVVELEGKRARICRKVSVTSHYDVIMTSSIDQIIF